MQDKLDWIARAVNRQRLLETAQKLVGVYSPTGQAKAALDCLAEILRRDGFVVERHAASYAQAPAVVVRWQGKKPGKTLQFNGHLDTVHLPFVPPSVHGDLLKGSGSSDMKAGTAAAVEALRALRDADALDAGAILLTAHDLHESPWGDGSQLNQLIADGNVGDAVLLPEYLSDVLPVIGRGGLTWLATIKRDGPPVHEVMRPDEPNVIAVGAELARRILDLDQRLQDKTHPLAGRESAFIGQIHGGQIFNQYPQECWLEGTRRWLPDTKRAPEIKRADVEIELRALTLALANETGTNIRLDINLMRDAFVLPDHPFVDAFQRAYAAVSPRPEGEGLGVRGLPIGAKPFCDDGNSFWALAHVPAITHGPKAGGAHTLDEWVSIDDLVRVAKVYALTALEFCSS
ncbi:MAG: M20/M25/M40 family metallo-hydrolase [Gemmataceae bacterium]|nr:M20/M25/M40 family metallo-hydrolase [Gemmataceae bacterium]MCI0740362.1 M20/M25/M40 family metallo-hydrolase [Gemmataceae bacterium]